MWVLRRLPSILTTKLQTARLSQFAEGTFYYIDFAHFKAVVDFRVELMDEILKEV